MPDERLLAETDSPYLAPEPLRGTQNTPANVPLVYKQLARLRGQDEAALAAQIRANAHALFYKLKNEG